MTSSSRLTSDVGEAEALGLARAVRPRGEIQPHVVRGGDEGWRQHRPAQPGLQLPCGGQHEPVSVATVRLCQVKVPEARTEGRSFQLLNPQ